MTAPAAPPRPCWCGRIKLKPFLETYSACPSCGTLVFQGPLPAADFYGEDYWYSRQSQHHGLPELPARAREDLYLRCPAWLRLVLRWKLPPADILEVGAAHGGFVACLQWAGFAARGLEMSPAIASWAAERFQVPMSAGTLEQQQLPAQSLDAICLFDVLEHLPDPVATLRECRRLLRSGGVLLLQTPERPPLLPPASLTRANHPFLRMLIPQEHLYLFTRDGLAEILRRAGFPWCVPQAALSPEFNMGVAAAAEPLAELSAGQQQQALEASSGGRLLGALLHLESEYNVADADRRGRLEIIQRLDPQLRKTPYRSTSSPLRRVVIDCGPMLPGGDNGGAKTLALTQIRNLAAIRPNLEFILLAYERVRKELEQLNLPNVSLHLLDSPPRFSFWRRWRRKPLPPLLERLNASVLFNPFIEPLYAMPGIPTVSVIHDAQFADLPHLFPEPVRLERSRHAQAALARSQRILCGTQFVRQSLLRHFPALADPDRIQVIPYVIHSRLAGSSTAANPALLHSVPGAGQPYFLYPANFWPHKNHRLLLTAYGLYRAAGGRWNLLCTGAPGQDRDELISAVRTFGWQDSVFFPGFLDESTFAALFSCASALLFPSLYEGFGMPLLEAMRFGVPIACARESCLPEVAGAAAVLFDPRRPESIADAMLSLQGDPILRERLSSDGKRRLAEFGNDRLMAERVLAQLEVACTTSLAVGDQILGIFDDGWVSEAVSVFWAPRPEAASLALELELEATPPASTVTLSGWPSGPVEISSQNPVTVSTPLDPAGGCLDLRLRPAFVPQEIGESSDFRRLTLRCFAVRLIAGSQVTKLPRFPGDAL